MTPEGVTIAHADRLFIGGQWVAAHSGREIAVESPVSETIVARVAEADEADMDRAVAAAREAFDHGPWPRLAPAQRAAVVARMATSAPAIQNRRARNHLRDTNYSLRVGLSASRRVDDEMYGKLRWGSGVASILQVPWVE